MDITIKMLREWGACYTDEDLKKLFGKRTSVTPLQIALTKKIPAQDKLWVLLREEIIPARELRLLACDFAEDALKLVKNPDKRSVNAIDVSRKYALGEATKEELAAAEAAAWAAAGTVVEAVVWAAEAAAWAAAGTVVEAAVWAVWAAGAAGAAAKNGQIKKVIKTLKQLQMEFTLKS